MPSSASSTLTAAIMQPTYLPWMGYFDLLDQSDLFIILDSVQFEKRSWQQRNRLKGPEGERMLTVPVLTAGLGRPKICEVKIDKGAQFHKSHLKSIQTLYSKTPFFEAYFKALEKIVNKEHELLADLNLELIQWLASELGIRKEIRKSSELNVDGKKTELLVALCGAVGAKRYLSAAGSKEYIEENNLFPSAGIELIYHSYDHPVYPQQYGTFLSHLSVLDLLFNVGGKEALAVIRSGRKNV